MTRYGRWKRNTMGYSLTTNKTEMRPRKSRTFEDFLRIIHNMSYMDYLSLNEYQQKALDIEYKENYGRN